MTIVEYKMVSFFNYLYNNALGDSRNLSCLYVNQSLLTAEILSTLYYIDHLDMVYDEIIWIYLEITSFLL